METNENFNALDELTELEKIGFSPATAKGIIKAIESSRADSVTPALEKYVTRAITESNDHLRTELKGNIAVLRNLVYWLFTVFGGFILGALALILDYLPTSQALLGS